MGTRWNEIMEEEDGELAPRERSLRNENRARKVGDAVQCMKRFFSGKSYYAAAPGDKDQGVPLEVLVCPTNINLVLDTVDFNLAMEIVQKEVQKKRNAQKPLARSGHLTDQEERLFYQGLVEEFRRLEITYEFQAGLLLLYLWICEGVEYTGEE